MVCHLCYLLKIEHREVHIAAATPVAMAYGLAYYCRTFLHMNFAWQDLRLYEYC